MTRIIVLRALLALAATPGPAAALPDELVAEALFLCDPLPPGGRDLNLSLGVAREEANPETGEASLVAAPRVQLALALGERVGLTADVGVATNGNALDAPGVSLKVLLRAPEAGATGLAASLDVYGSSHHPLDSEAGLGLGAIRALGRVTLRASASVATIASGWGPHLHAGASAALALGARWRVLGEVVGEVSRAEASWAAGPTVKVQLVPRTALAAGVLVPLEGSAPVFTAQLTQAL